ncbi:MAG: aminoacyl-tRNA hydrolase [Oscillospiraceae bacterium]|nr:aminoacyl-tRNA hydrolase [Oscillospiraceae bacterium]
MLKFFSHKTAAPAGPVEFLIVGLGNPGREYESTRHNAGFMALDHIAQKQGVKIDRLKFKSLCGDGVIAGHRVLLMKPSTFMNLSGQAVQEAAAFYKIPMERVLVFVDDISLAPGSVRIRRKGTDGGHNGLKNIIYLTGSDQFPRVKIGVGAKPHPDYDLAQWVTSRFSTDEKKALEPVLEHAADMAELIVSGRMDEAMNVYNGK